MLNFGGTTQSIMVFFIVLIVWYWNLHVEDKVNKVVVGVFEKGPMQASGLERHCPDESAQWRSLIASKRLTQWAELKILF